MIGDGTGCGKGREAAGIIMSGWLGGRTRAVWLSKSKTLIEDAVRDWTDLGGSPTDIQPIDRWTPDEDITLGRGILFMTYATLRSVGKTGRTRLEQLVDWAGDDFEGVIAFDEAHAMQNAAGSSEGRGTAPSQQGLAGLRLQIALPRARSSTSRRPAPPMSQTSPMPSGSASGGRATPIRSPPARTSWLRWRPGASRPWRWSPAT